MDYIEAFKKFMQEQQISTGEVARKLCVAPQTVASWLRGDTKPSPNSVEKLADLWQRRGQLRTVEEVTRLISRSRGTFTPWQCL